MIYTFWSLQRHDEIRMLVMNIWIPFGLSGFFSCSIEGGVTENDDVAGALVPAKTWVVSCGIIFGEQKTNRGVKKCRGRTNRRKNSHSAEPRGFFDPAPDFLEIVFFFFLTSENPNKTKWHQVWVAKIRFVICWFSN